MWEQKARAEADPDRREVIYRQAIQHYPKDATLLNYFALFLSWIPDRDVEAERLFRNAVAIEPNNTTLITNLASNLFCKAKSDPKEIESLFHDALEIAQESANVRTRYALFLYTFKKNLEEAEEQFRTGIQLAPEAPFPAHEYANFIMNERTDDQEADRLFQLSITDSSSNANWLCNYAGLQISRDQTGAALTTLKNAKENIQTDDGGPVWKSRVAAKISIYSAILASLQRKDPSRPLRELHNELSTRFPGLPWDVKRVLAYAKERISQEEYTLYSGLAEAFLDKAASAKAMRLIDEFNNGKRTKPRRVKTSAKGSKRKTKGISRKMLNRESDEPPTDD